MEWDCCKFICGAPVWDSIECFETHLLIGQKEHALREQPLSLQLTLRTGHCLSREWGNNSLQPIDGETGKGYVRNK